MADNFHDRICFLSVPESLRGLIDGGGHDHGPDSQLSHGGGGFSINPNIPIPVEIPEGEEKLNLEELSWEMIVSGMLRVISEGKAGVEWLDYYRHFVLAVKPGIMGEFTEAAILKAKNGDFDLALEILDALRGMFPGSPVTRLNRALVLEEQASLFERQGRKEADAAFEAAATAYEEAVAFEPPFPNAHFNAGFFYLGRRNFSRAMECFAAYLETADDAEKRDQAESIVQEIEKNGLNDENFQEACDLIRQGQEEAGMHSIHDFIERYPSVWNGWFVLGWALRRLGRWNDGAAAFRKAIELGGGNSDTHNEFAICLMESGDFAAARHELETALREDGENIKIISNMGVLAMKNGDHDEAAAFFRTVLELDPEDPVAKEFWGTGQLL
ncbi:MAG: tetratricopeptide repeat protein [Treponema sp.]|jgi:tetratricopeptide (TPR) repeat protein|nr:tetratricopeptide repeat protein [Treponema sp.]